MTRIDQLMIGPLRPLGPAGAPSGIDKKQVTGRLRLGRQGFAGDAQGDTKHHGGPEKAVHHYAFDHYAGWREAIGQCDVLAQPGAFGENFSTVGVTETDIAIGDTFRAGTALIQVSQGRQPCWRLNMRFGLSDMAVRVQKSGRTGWYYRVIEEGHIEAGDDLLLTDRLSPDWTIARLWRALYVDTLNFDELALMSELAHLPENWRRHATRRLATREVEDWSRRLRGA